MRKEIFLPIRQRRDGSEYFQKRHPIWSAIGEPVAMVLFIVTVLLLLALTILQPPPARAQQATLPAAESAMAANALKVHRKESADAKQDVLAGVAVPTETTNLPLLWPLQGRLTDGFGARRNPFHRRLSEFHLGQDIAAPMGTPVSVTAGGTVVFAGYKRGYGRVVIVDHGNNITTRSGHLSVIDTTPGALIKRGESIGRVGSTGRSTGAHLHYEVRMDEVPVNPLTYLPTVPPAAVGEASK